MFLSYGRADIKHNPEKGREWQTVQSPFFCHKIIEHNCLTIARLVLAPQKCCCYLTQITEDSNPPFAKRFQAGSWDRACCHLLCVISFSFLFIIAGAQSQALGISTFQSLSAVLFLIPTAPWLRHLCLCWSRALASAGAGSCALRPPASACAHSSEALPGAGFSVAIPRTHYISGPSW